MTAKTLLERIIKIRKAIDYRKTKIDTLVDQAEISSSRLTGMPHNPSPVASAIESAVCRKVDLEREIARLPQGSIAKKTIRGKEYYYHRIHTDGKRKEIYA